MQGGKSHGINCVKRETIKIETKMKKQMKRTVYEAPVTELFQVELEGGFMAASIVENDNQSSVESTGHEIGETIDAKEDLGFTIDSWGD